MSQDRLFNLSFISIEYKTVGKIDFDQFISNFVERFVQLFFNLLFFKY